MSIQRFPNNSGSSESLFKGTWDANTNTPTLANTDSVTAGSNYIVSDAGTVDLGAGDISFDVSDIIINNGTVWSRIDATDAVISVAGKNGVVVLDADDISDGTTNKAFTSTEKTKLDGLGATVTEIKTSNYTIVSGDKGKTIISDHATTNPQTITMGTGLSWAVGDSITILNGSSFRDLQLTKSGWIYWNDVSANITLKPYQGIKITNVATDYYLTQTFNALTSEYATALANLKDYIRYISHYVNEQTMSSASLSDITGARINVQGESNSLMRFEAHIRIELVTPPTTVNLRIESSNAYGNFQNIIGRVIDQMGTETKIMELNDFGGYPNQAIPESEISLDTSSYFAGEFFYIKYEWIQRQPSNGYYTIQLQCVGGGSVKIKEPYMIATRIGTY